MILCPHFFGAIFFQFRFFTALTLQNNVWKFAVCSRYILFMVVAAIFYNYLLSKQFLGQNKRNAVPVWEIKRDLKCSVVLLLLFFSAKMMEKKSPKQRRHRSEKKKTKQNIKSNPNQKDSFISSNLGFYLRNEKINNCTHTNRHTSQRQLAKRKETRDMCHTYIYNFFFLEYFICKMWNANDESSILMFSFSVLCAPAFFSMFSFLLVKLNFEWENHSM